MQRPWWLGAALAAALSQAACRDVALTLDIDAPNRESNAVLNAKAGARYSIWAHYSVDSPKTDAPHFCHDLELQLAKGDEIVESPRCYAFPRDDCRSSNGRRSGDCKTDCTLPPGLSGRLTLRAKVVKTEIRCIPNPAIGAQKEPACGGKYDNCYKALTHPEQLADYTVKVVEDG